LRVLYWIDLVIFPAFGAFVLSEWQWNVRYFIGIGMAAVGFALWLTARIQIGQSFSIRARARRLVTTGLYSKFRHPIYLFGGVAYSGLFIAWGKLVPLLCFVLIYPIYQILRLRKEERVLEEAFGEEYRQHKARTWL
jgi:protein-S-isoprenylcysteine O-methyltransferase Ste14